MNPKHEQGCDNCGRKFLRGTLARRHWCECNIYLCKECLAARGEDVDPVDYNYECVRVGGDHPLDPPDVQFYTN